MRNLLTILLLLLVSPALAETPAIRAELVAEGLDQPIFVTAPAGDPRLVVVEQTGRIRILRDGKVQPEPFLDISDAISPGGERGILGLAFHPDYAANGRFFVDYTDGSGNTQIVGYTVSSDPDRADAASATTLLSIDQPYPNHNGGWVGFGPDGLLYIGMGDGGDGGDPQNRAQNPDELLGKILRIDVDAGSPYAMPPGNPFASGGGRPEIFALGVRNPWRMAFDGNLLFVADVGQDRFEEISVITTNSAGANLGWRVMEGAACFAPADGCDTSGLVLPVYSYPHSEGCSITGGFVYRGEAIPALKGQYLFADYCYGFVRALFYPEGVVTDLSPILGNIGNIASFGTDSAGEIYAMNLDGKLYRIAPTR